MTYDAAVGTTAGLRAGEEVAGDPVRSADVVLCGQTRRLVVWVLVAGALQAFVVGLVLHRVHNDPNDAHEAVYVTPVLHWLRDSALAAPGAILLLLGATVLARWIATRHLEATGGVRAHLLLAALGAVAYAIATVPAGILHARLFTAHHEGTVFFLHAADEAVLTLRYSFAILLGLAAVVGLPWNQRSTTQEDLGCSPDDSS